MKGVVLVWRLTVSLCPDDEWCPMLWPNGQYEDTSLVTALSLGNRSQWQQTHIYPGHTTEHYWGVGIWNVGLQKMRWCVQLVMFMYGQCYRQSPWQWCLRMVTMVCWWTLCYDNRGHGDHIPTQECSSGSHRSQWPWDWDSLGQCTPASHGHYHHHYWHLINTACIPC